MLVALVISFYVLMFCDIKENTAEAGVNITCSASIWS